MKRKTSVLVCALLTAAFTVSAQKYEQYKTADPKELIKRSDLSEQELESIQRYFLFDAKDTVRSNELQQLLINKDPKGPYARISAFHKIMGVSGNAKLLAAANAFLSAFPYAEWLAHPTNQEFIYYSLHRNMGTAYFETKQYD